MTCRKCMNSSLASIIMRNHKECLAKKISSFDYKQQASIDMLDTSLIAGLTQGNLVWIAVELGKYDCLSILMEHPKGAEAAIQPHSNFYPAIFSPLEYTMLCNDEMAYLLIAQNYKIDASRLLTVAVYFGDQYSAEELLPDVKEPIMFTKDQLAVLHGENMPESNATNLVEYCIAREHLSLKKMLLNKVGIK